MALARAVQHQAIEQTVASPGASPDASPAGLLFTRLARALRQTVALDSRLLAESAARATGSITERARRAAAERQHKNRARLELRDRLVRSAEADPRDTDSLLRDLHDRLYDDDIDEALTVVAITDIVVALCAEFGLTPDLSQCTDAELGLLAPRPP